MSTIASPRPLSLRRTPTNSTRPSIDTVRSAVTSPTLAPTTNPAPQPTKRSNRAALREYYNLRAAAAPPRIKLPDSEVPASDIDAEDFKPEEYVDKVVGESTLEELLRLYTRVLGEVRALDAEKKALVYDNYSKLITATETIRKMRANMDPLNPMASTLDPAIAQIYTQASSIREALRRDIPPPQSEEGKKRDAEQRRRRTKELAVEALATPDRMRALVEGGKVDEARRLWERPRRLLVSWKEKGVGGDDVQQCIDDGDDALQASEGTQSSRPSKDSIRITREEVP
ncbi:vacuolar protein sorting-associated protein 51 [Emericellopsis cladophorae]|uniref:Vacuolar protein sorting-associated protein 51 homolog n=1 Tax=Emericellopsis cladophorae TaxID=2686198 RepID=A0A9Q0BBN3_9HYPO|nr:vacuolar protein sorting-associated protein 51 [Emericellopsis cladophorae]KAI6779972.1 vacuolar protein sorting-associated protein 51 [Emericellopsis cladophorae]